RNHAQNGSPNARQASLQDEHGRPRGIKMPTAKAKRYLSSGLLQRLAMLRGIEALQLLLHRNPDRDEEAHQFEKAVSHDDRPAQGDRHAVKLGQHEMRISFQKPGSPSDRGGRKPPGQQGARQSADTVDAEHVERIVIFETVFEPGAGPVTYRAGDDAD